MMMRCMNIRNGCTNGLPRALANARFPVNGAATTTFPAATGARPAAIPTPPRPPRRPLLSFCRSSLDDPDNASCSSVSSALHELTDINAKIIMNVIFILLCLAGIDLKIFFCRKLQRLIIKFYPAEKSGAESKDNCTKDIQKVISQKSVPGSTNSIKEALCTSFIQTKQHLYAMLFCVRKEDKSRFPA